VGGQHHDPAALLPRKEPLGWTPEPVWKRCPVKITPPPPCWQNNSGHLTRNPLTELPRNTSTGSIIQFNTNDHSCIPGYIGLTYAPNIVTRVKSRRIRWAGHVACMGDMRNVYIILVGKPEQRPLGRPRR
jgi:hypothetical protein